MDEPTKFIYNSIANLYAIDISKRILGIYTFADSSESQAKEAIKHVEIDIADDFEFNNGSLYSSPDSFYNDYN